VKVKKPRCAIPAKLKKAGAVILVEFREYREQQVPLRARGFGELLATAAFYESKQHLPTRDFFNIKGVIFYIKGRGVIFDSSRNRSNFVNILLILEKRRGGHGTPGRKCIWGTSMGL
jgi:hypothetical protein